jgi:pimeloyl-ACP methyl ester carboxylesterase
VHDIKLLQGRIAALQRGQNTRPLLLFIHGYLDNAASFYPLLSYLQDFHCIAIDLPGHGKSMHRSADAHYHLTDYVYDVHCLISAEKWQNVTLVGHSLGGIISTLYAAAFPEWVRQVVSIESFGPLTEPEHSSTEQLRQSIESRQLASKAIKKPHSMQQIIEARMRVSDLSRADAQAILSRNTEYDADKLQWVSDKRLRTKSALRFTPNQAINMLENITCPYHVILGDRGFDKVKGFVESRKKYIHQFTVSTLKGGHHVHMESPEQVAQCIIESEKSYRIAP